MAVSFNVRKACVRDVAELERIEREAFPDPSWSARDFLRYDCLVADAETENGIMVVAGFLVSRENFAGSVQTPPEREILNFAVGKRFQCRGVGTALLEHELERKSDVYLEVRESNAAALHVYQKAGFTEVCRRSNYYDNPAESAIVMCLKW